MKPKIKKSRTDFIIKQLESHNIPYNDKTNDIMVFCPFGNHRHRKPQLAIHKSGKLINCWSCPAKGNWNTYAKKMGLEFIDFKNDIDPVYFEREKNTEVTIPEILLPIKQDLPRYKEEDIPLKTLKKFESKIMYDAKRNSHRVWIPIYLPNTNKLIGWSALALEPNPKLKVLNSSGKWARKGLFGLRFIKEPYIILVEGISDTLRLHSHNLPAVGILGTQNWTEYKRNLLLSYGFKYVILGFDEDPSGRRCTQAVKKDLQPFVTLKFWNWGKENSDPGNTSLKNIKFLKKFIGNLN